jgi:hypothetical protein
MLNSSQFILRTNSTLFGPNISHACRYYCDKEFAIGLNMNWKRQPIADMWTNAVCIPDITVGLSLHLAVYIRHYRIAAAWIKIKCYILRVSLKFEVKLKFCLESISSIGGVTDFCVATF